MAVVHNGCGADVDVQSDENAFLMLKLQVFQNDDEELVKMVQISLLRGNSELLVHLLLTTAAVYVLIPQVEESGAALYETYAAFPLADLHGVRSTRGGQGLCLAVRSRRGDQAWHFMTGDTDVTDAFARCTREAAAAAGVPDVPGGAVDDARWDGAVQTFAGAQQGEWSRLSVHVCYAEVDAGKYAREEIHSGQLELKEPGFLSSSWRLQYFVIRGKTLQQFGDAGGGGCAAPEGKPKATWAIDDPTFYCRLVEDPERADCIEIGNAATGSVTVAGHGPHDMAVWHAFLTGHEAVVIGTDEPIRHTAVGNAWLPAVALLTETHLYVARPDFVKSTLRLLWSVAVESVTALRSSPDARTSVFVDYDEQEEDHDGDDDDGEHVSRRALLMKTRPALLRLADDLGESWKALYQVDLERVML